MKNSIIVFTLDGCGYCIDLKKRLRREQISYHEIEVNENPNIWNEVVSQTGHNSLPSVYVSLDEGDEGPIFIPERDFESQDELIELIKKYI